MQSLLRHQLVLQLASGAASVLAMAWVFVVGRQLGPTEADEFFAALALATMAGVAFGGLRSALGRECACLRTDPQALAHLVAAGERTLLLVASVIAPAAVLVLLAVAPQLGLGDLTVVAIAACVAAKLLLDVRRAALGGRGSYGLLAGNQLIEAAARIVLGIGCLALAPTATTGIAVYALASAIGWMVARRAFVAPARSVAPVRAQIFPALRPLTAWNVLVALAQHVDVVIVAAIVPDEAAAAYGGAAALLRGFAALAVPVQLQLTPHLVSRRALGQRDHRASIGLLGVYLAIAAVPLALCLGWPRSAIELAYGDAFTAHAELLGPMACGAVLVHLGITMAGILIASGRFGFVWSYAAAVLVHIGLVAIGATHSVAMAAQAAWIGPAIMLLVLAIEVLRSSPARADG